VVVAPRRPVISVKEERSAKTTVISTSRPSSRWAPHCVQQLGLRGLRRMPRHLKKTVAKPTSGMPQTTQLAARGGVLVSKGTLIPTQTRSFRWCVYVKIDQTRAASEATVRQIRLLADHC